MQSVPAYFKKKQNSAMLSQTETAGQRRRAMMREFFRQFFAALLAMAAAFQAGNWAISYAFEHRGYQAAGGEYLFIPIVYFGVYTAVIYLFDNHEEKYGTGRQENEDFEYLY